MASRDKGRRVKQQRASERGKKAMTRGCSHTRPCSESVSRSVVSDSLRPHGLYSPGNSPGQNTGMGSLSLLQGIFPTQGSNPGLPHCRWILYQLSHKGSPNLLFIQTYVHLVNFFESVLNDKGSTKKTQTLSLSFRKRENNYDLNSNMKVKICPY